MEVGKPVETALRATLWILLGGWIGALSLFALGVAPLAFTTLPAGEGGKVVAPLLAALNSYGLIAGIVLAAIAWRSQRGALLVAIPIVLTIVCAFSEFWVTDGIDAVRPNAFGVDVTAEAAKRFSFLHRLSQALYALVMAGTFVLALLHAHFDATQESRKLS